MIYHRWKKVLPVILLAVLMTNCNSGSSERSENADSLLLQTANAQNPDSQKVVRTEQIYQSRQNAITRAVQLVSPAVVGINVIEIKRYRQRSPFQGDPFWEQLFPELYKDRYFEQEVKGLGSGFIISGDGYILTNDHVAGDASEIIVTLPGGQRHNAKLVGTDNVSDISVLKIDARDLPHLEFDNSDNCMVGEWVIAIGNPFGLFELNNQPSVTVGVISALHRDWGKDRQSGRVYLDMIQTDAAINHGNSGGPLVNASGKVIGMNTFIYTGSSYQQGFIGLGFAIPINRIERIVDEIKTTGSVNRNIWWGFKIQDLNPLITKALGIDIKKGVIINSIESNSSADKAGLKMEDVIIRVTDRPISNTNQMVKILEDMDLKVGDEIEVEVIRDKKQKKLTMKLIEKKVNQR
jgi:serine protease Do